MIAAGLWIDRRDRLRSPHQPRRRRDCFAELVQIDGSEHAWFEDRAAKCTLLAFVDDATSRLMHSSESAFDYFRATLRDLETHGKPIAFYSDKHSIFRVNAKDAAGGDGATPFGREPRQPCIGASTVEMPARRSSLTNRSLQRPERALDTPLACGLLAQRSSVSAHRVCR